MIDEANRKSISNSLWHKLYATSDQFAKENKDNMPPAPELPVPGEKEAFLEFDANTPVSEDNVRESRATGLSNAKASLSRMTAAETNRLAYKDMPMKWYIFGTLAFYVVVIIGSIFINSVSIVLDFAGAFAVSALAFLFPGMFYIKGVARFGQGQKFYNCLAKTYIGIAVFNCILGITSTILNILTSEGGE